MSDARLLHGDCLERMAEIEAGSVDAIVTDPPAGISFMGKDWDNFGGRSNPNAEKDREDAKGLGPINAKNPYGKTTQPFGYSGSAMPKGRKERDAFIEFLRLRLAECYRIARPGARALVWAIPRTSHWTATAIEDAGWIIEDRVSHLFGSGFPKHKSKLKPAMEDWWMAWKPDRKATPLNIDACRIEMSQTDADFIRKTARPNTAGQEHVGPVMCRPKAPTVNVHPSGRWPAHLTHDGSDEVMGAFAAFGERAVSGSAKNGRPSKSVNDGDRSVYGNGLGRQGSLHNDSGTAARFFYCAKASKADRGDGNTHPTVKNSALMSWLVRLIAKPGELVADPFMGSGSTGVACVAEGVRFVGIEQSADYLSIAESRIAAARAALPLFAREVPA